MKRAIIDLDTVSADVLARRIEMLSSSVDNRTEKEERERILQQINTMQSYCPGVEEGM